MKVFLNYVKEHRKLLILALLLATINQVFSLLDPQIFRLIIDNYATKASDISRDVFIKGILLLLLGSIGVALVSRIAKNFQDYYVNVISQKVGTSMYSDSVKHTLNLPYNIFEDQSSGQILQKLQKARNDSQTALQSFINVVFLSFIGVLFVLIYAFIVNWLVGLAYLLIIPIIGISTYMISKGIKAAQKNIVIESAALAGSTTETLRNIELVKSLGLEKQEIGRLNKVNDKILDLELSKVKIIRKLSFIQGTLINALRSSLLLLMLWLIFREQISLGEFFSLFIYSFFVFSPLQEFGNIAALYQQARASNEQLEEILKIKQKQKPINIVEINSLKNISFKKLGFKYESGDIHSIYDINIKIKEGETIAFVGPSGSGKTTMVKLILGLYEPSNGELLLNDINSKDIDYDKFRKKIGLVSQETQLFSGTIRENLLFVNPNATDEECVKALEAASVIILTERGGKGLETRIGEGGIKISGGERQRLAIARALLRNPELIIFDEATSSLDSITEKSITETIKEIVKKRKVITILVAHRLSTIMHADKIYVFEKGNIIEEGNHNSLLRKKGLYAALWREQSANGD
ncbi:ABC transporter ATP-binding protein [Candidatus Woesearchaeota archaeon]|nr:ABC transporter ATP-binding protein [Candidatus Woesearchaeota archaeon]